MNLLTKVKGTYFGYGLKTSVSADNIITMKKDDLYPYTITVKPEGNLTTVIVDRKGMGKYLHNIGFTTQTEAIEFIKDFLKDNDQQAENEVLSIIEGKRAEQRELDRIALEENMDNIRNNGDEETVKLAELCYKAYQNMGYLSINDSLYISLSYEQINKDAPNSAVRLIAGLCGFTFTLNNSINIMIDLDTFRVTGGDVIKYGSWYEIDSDTASEYMEEIYKQL